jgi:hypothetical protein
VAAITGSGKAGAGRPLAEGLERIPTTPLALRALEDDASAPPDHASAARPRSWRRSTPARIIGPVLNDDALPRAGDRTAAADAGRRGSGFSRRRATSPT